MGGAATFTGQNTQHGASRLKIGQDTTAISQLRAYGADTSTAGIFQFTVSSSDGSVGGERFRLADNMTFNGQAGTSPIFEMINNDNEDTDTGRETSLRFSGHRSGGEDVVNAQISGHHAGSSDNDNGLMILFTNNGSGLDEKMRLNFDEIIINQNGNDQNLRVETDARANGFVIDASTDNAGFMVAPVTDSLSSFNLVGFGQTGVVQSRQANPSITIADNVYRANSGSTGYKAIVTAASSMITQSAGAIDFYTNASASAGADVTLGQRMTIDIGGTVTLHSSAIRVPDGSAAAPSFTFGNDTNSGIFSPSADNLGFSVGGNQKAFLSASQFNVTGNGVFSGSISKGSGSFKIDHPLPAKTDTHHLVHSFVEAPQADNIYRGSVDLVGGSATVNIDTAAGMTDGTFVLLNTNVQCFTSNESGWTAIKGSVSGNTLTITAQDNACTDTISWMVVGERHDQHMKDTEWTDSDGKVIVEPEKTTEGE